MDMLNFLASNKNARKIFGKRELKIVEKQLLGIRLTQSEKNRLSRDIRPKFDFIKESARFSKEFDLKKGAKIKELVEEAKESILEHRLFKNIKEIVLFGSAVDNTLTFRSDIDIAVKFDDISLKEATLFRRDILGNVNSRVDIQVYNYLPKKIKAGVDKGTIIYKNEN